MNGQDDLRITFMIAAILLAVVVILVEKVRRISIGRGNAKRLRACEETNVV